MAFAHDVIQRETIKKDYLIIHEYPSHICVFFRKMVPFEGTAKIHSIQKMALKTPRWFIEHFANGEKRLPPDSGESTTVVETENTRPNNSTTRLVVRVEIMAEHCICENKPCTCSGKMQARRLAYDEAMNQMITGDNYSFCVRMYYEISAHFDESELGKNSENQRMTR